MLLNFGPEMVRRTLIAALFRVNGGPGMRSAVLPGGP
jgi:hypothetical protein